MPIKEDITVDIFSKEYFESELKSVYFPVGKKGNIEITILDIKPDRRYRGFCYETILTEPINNVPVFKIDGKVWMSLAPMEIESHAMPILLANGRVGVAGLGMGYYVQRILDSVDVFEVVVYETNQEVIDFYFDRFGKHKKLKIFCKDARSIENESFDFFCNDTYQDQMDYEQAIPDLVNIMNKNSIEVYHFWTLENVLLELVLGAETILPFHLKSRYELFFKSLREHEKEFVIRDRGHGENIFLLFEQYNVFGIL